MQGEAWTLEQEWCKLTKRNEPSVNSMSYIARPHAKFFALRIDFARNHRWKMRTIHERKKCLEANHKQSVASQLYDLLPISNTPFYRMEEGFVGLAKLVNKRLW